MRRGDSAVSCSGPQVFVDRRSEAISSTGRLNSRGPSGVATNRCCTAKLALPVQVEPWLSPCHAIVTTRPSGRLSNDCAA